MKSCELGKVTSWNGSYAFIRPHGDHERDLFAHESHLQDGDLRPGDKVTFERSPDPRKPGREMATSVRLVGDETKPDDVGAGMYKEPETDSALAAGLRKLIGNQ